MANKQELAEAELSLPDGVTEYVPLTSMIDLFTWYKHNLCQPEIRDCRGYRIRFLDTDFVHLIQLVDKYGDEPKNKRMTIEQIQCGRVKLTAGRFDAGRTKELSLARAIVENPSFIVPNWQVMGRANPGEAYIRNFRDRRAPEIQSFNLWTCGKDSMGGDNVSQRTAHAERAFCDHLALKSEEAAQGGLL